MGMAELVTTGRVKKPNLLILYGVPGIGKTQFGSGAPDVVFITGEEIEEIESAKFPKCETWDDFINYLTMVRDDDHKYKSLCVDTLDSMEALCWKKIVGEDVDAKGMATAEGGFGNAFTMAAEMMANVRDEYLVPIREKRGMNIILLCHSSRNKVDDVMNQISYDTFEMKLHKNKKGWGTYTVFSEWVSNMLFCNFKVHAYKDKSTKKMFGIGEGERKIYCTPRPAYDAKNRFNLPDEIDLDYKALEKHIDAFYEGKSAVDIPQLKKEIDVLVGKIKDSKVKKDIEANLEGVGDDVNRLLKAKDYIRGVVG